MLTEDSIDKLKIELTSWRNLNFWKNSKYFYSKLDSQTELLLKANEKLLAAYENEIHKLEAEVC